MTIQERLRETAKYLRTQHPRPFSQGEYVDELLDRAADEMDELLNRIGQLAREAVAQDEKAMMERGG